ncbi:MAG TPA: L,D-transpeptidase, partial [Minicystis sp.]|nr:L,D-transpeptidase [Minicystis sp.]
HTVTREPSARFAAEAEAIAPAAGPLPYRYALSNGAPMYARLPDAREQAKAERGYGKPGRTVHLSRALAAHEELARDGPVAAADAAPAFALDGQPLLPERLDLVANTMPLGSMLSFTRAFEANGRAWLLSTDLTFVPADRVRPFAPSAFHGTRLGEGAARLPIAWMKTFSRPKFVLAGGAANKTGAEWPARAFAELTGRSETLDGERYLETRERTDAGEPVWVSTRDATVVEPADKLPFVVKADERWIVVSLSQGTLVAYDGLRPVYATLVSPGKGGIPVKGRDPVQAGTTPLGAYRITFKDRAATMSPDKKGDPRTLVIADVPFTQYFAPPFALHAAYWHERFGEPTSAGCVNLSPIDAEALFAFTEPAVPEGWAGATGAGAPENGRASWVVIRR